MPGAIIAIDQDRPGGSTSFGTPGVARNDLWLSRTIRPRSSQSGNLSQEWTLLDIPPTSTVTLTNADQVTCSFTPDVPGTYRIQLVTNGGGTGNIQILVARVRYDTSGALTNRGWALPAFGELPPEANYNSNLRGWDEPWEFILADLLTVIASFNPTLAGDVTGLASATTVVKLNGVPINLSSTPTIVNQVLAWDGTKLTYTLISGFTAGQDLTGSSTAQRVAKITGNSIGPSGLVGLDSGNNVVLETGLPLPVELMFVARVADTPNTTPTRVGSRIIDLTAFPSTLADGRTLHAAIVFSFETTAGTATVQLQNVTDNETTGTAQTTSSTSSTQVSLSLTIGSSAGNLKTGKLYEVQLSLSGGSSLDRATCTSARLVLSYS